MSCDSWRLSGEFWRNFVDEYWEKKPTIIPQPFAEEMISQPEALAVLRKGFSDPDPDLAERRFFYVEREQQMDTPAEFLPRENEDSISEFASRLREENRLSNYQFTIYNTHRYVPDLFFRTRVAFASLLELVGLPAYQFNTDLFFGEYRVTAGGLHKDNASVFSYVVHGAKRMLVWPFEYFAAETNNPEADKRRDVLPHVDHSQHLEMATDLQGQPGDVLYWPSTSWHIAIGDGRPHMTFNMSPYFPTRATDRLEMILGPMVREILGEEDWLTFLPYKRAEMQQLAQKLPAQVEKVLATYRAVTSSPKLETLLMGAWLRSLTGFGFSVLPPPDTTTTVSPAKLYAGDREFPVVYVKVSRSQRVVAANGNLFVAPEGPPLEHVLRAANSGEEFSMEHLGDRIGADPAAEDLSAETIQAEIRSVLEKLVAFRAVRPVA